MTEEEVTEEEGDNYVEGNDILLFTFNPLFREIFLKRTFFLLKVSYSPVLPLSLEY